MSYITTHWPTTISCMAEDKDGEKEYSIDRCEGGEGMLGGIPFLDNFKKMQQHE